MFRSSFGPTPATRAQTFSMDRRLPPASCIAVVGALLTGCVTPPAEYERVVDQGVSFQDAYLDYGRSARALSVRARTLSMASTLLPMAAGAERLERYERYVSGIEAELETYETILAHGTAMRTYLMRLQALASTNAARDSRLATAEAVKSLNSLADRLDQQGIASGTATIVGELVQAGVSIRQRELLAEELVVNGETIEANILLQIEALGIIDRKLEQDLQSTSREQRNMVELQLLEASDIDPSAFRAGIVTTALASTVQPGAATASGEKLLLCWRDLVRRAQGDLTLEELYVSLGALAAELGTMEAATAAVSGLLD